MPDFSHDDDFAKLHEEFFPKVYSYVSYRIGNVRETEDIVSKVFLRAVEAYGRFERKHEHSFGAWIFRIARNAILDFHRQGRTRELSLAIDNLPDIATAETPVEEQLSMKERFRLLRELIDSLSPRTAEVITLRFYGDLSNQEIAEVLEIAPRTVSSYLARGLRNLEERYILQHKNRKEDKTQHGK